MLSAIRSPRFVVLSMLFGLSANLQLTYCEFAQCGLQRTLCLNPQMVYTKITVFKRAANKNNPRRRDKNFCARAMCPSPALRKFAVRLACASICALAAPFLLLWPLNGQLNYDLSIAPITPYLAPVRKSIVSQKNSINKVVKCCVKANLKRPWLCQK